MTNNYLVSSFQPHLNRKNEDQNTKNVIYSSYTQNAPSSNSKWERPGSNERPHNNHKAFQHSGILISSPVNAPGVQFNFTGASKQLIPSASTQNMRFAETGSHFIQKNFGTKLLQQKKSSKFMTFDKAENSSEFLVQESFTKGHINNNKSSVQLKRNQSFKKTGLSIGSSAISKNSIHPIAKPNDVGVLKQESGLVLTANTVEAMSTSNRVSPASKFTSKKLTILPKGLETSKKKTTFNFEKASKETQNERANDPSRKGLVRVSSTFFKSNESKK